jgi:hypothetical protein
MTETPDENIPQDPGIPGHRTLEEQTEGPDLDPEPQPESPGAYPDYDEEGERAPKGDLA